MTTALTTTPQGVALQAARPTDLLRDLGEIERVAKACAASGYYRDVRDASQAVVKMLAGREMGIGPIQALAGIYIVEGKPTAGANLIAANVKRSGRYDYRVKRRDDEACILTWYERGEIVGESAFTVADAKQAGLWGRGAWAKYPRAMLFARALTEGVRVFCPDAAGGVIYTTEELVSDLDATEDGTPAEPRDVTPEPVREPEPEPAAAPPPNPQHANGVVTVGQVRRLFALAGERAKDLGDDDLRVDIVRDVLARRGIEHSRDIPRAAYERICAEVETWEIPTSAATVDEAAAEEAF